MSKLSISCDELPVDLPDAAMLAAWRELFDRKCGEFGAEIVARCDLPGKSHVAILPLTALSIVTLDGKFDRIGRSRSGLAGDDTDALTLAINGGSAPLCFLHQRHEIAIAPGQSMLFGGGMVGQFQEDQHVDVSIFRLPRAALAASLRHTDFTSAQTLPHDCEPLRMLDSYARAMMTGDGIRDPSTASSIGSHLVDLIGLALALGRGDNDPSHSRSLRAARLHTLVGAIEAGYLDPKFSIHAVAAKQRVTPRYLQTLLAESGTGFAERVLELRLCHAERLLTRADQGRRKISDVAFTSGFNDVSYFTRRFRARFGLTPGEARAVRGAASR